MPDAQVTIGVAHDLIGRNLPARGSAVAVVDDTGWWTVSELWEACGRAAESRLARRLRTLATAREATTFSKKTAGSGKSHMSTAQIDKIVDRFARSAPEDAFRQGALAGNEHLEPLLALSDVDRRAIVVRLADRAAFLLDGELVEIGEAGPIFANPQDQRTEDYITGRFG